MAEKPDSDEFEEDDADEAVDSDDPQLEHLIKDLESQKRRGGAKAGEPAWRRLEKYLENKRTAELLSDFDDYEVGDAGGRELRAAGKTRVRKARR
jgi:N-glycosylase/DNA lyase